MARSDEDHADVKSNCRQHHEVNDSGGANHTATKRFKLSRDAPVGDHSSWIGPRNNRIRIDRKHKWDIEKTAEHEADRQVARQEGCHHADRQHRQADQPVAEVVVNEQAHIELAHVSDISTQ